MLNKQSIQGYYKYCQFRDEFFKKQKAAARKQITKSNELKDNLATGLLVTIITIVIMATFVGVLIYIKEMQ